jgi:hypothetical protein
MGTWEHGNMGIDEVAWEHQLGNKTTGWHPFQHAFQDAYSWNRMQFPNAVSVACMGMDLG